MQDASEKLFCGGKTFLGDKDLQVYGDSFADVKIVIEFIALIIWNRIYNCFQEEMTVMGKRADFMTVPEAIRELEKIEMVRLTDNRYRLDHGVTETQKLILKAFGMDVGAVKYYAGEIGRMLGEKG